MSNSDRRPLLSLSPASSPVANSVQTNTKAFVAIDVKDEKEKPDLTDKSSTKKTTKPIAAFVEAKSDAPRTFRQRMETCWTSCGTCFTYCDTQIDACTASIERFFSPCTTPIGKFFSPCTTPMKKFASHPITQAVGEGALGAGAFIYNVTSGPLQLAWSGIGLLAGGIGNGLYKKSELRSEQKQQDELKHTLNTLATTQHQVDDQRTELLELKKAHDDQADLVESMKKTAFGEVKDLPKPAIPALVLPEPPSITEIQEETAGLMTPADIKDAKAQRVLQAKKAYLTPASREAIKGKLENEKKQSEEEIKKTINEWIKEATAKIPAIADDPALREQIDTTIRELAPKTDFEQAEVKKTIIAWIEEFANITAEDKEYRTQLDNEIKALAAQNHFDIEKPYSLILTESPPTKETLDELKITSDIAYVRCGNSLFRINKLKSLCEELDLVNATFDNFDKELKPAQTARTLREKELDFIKSVTEPEAHEAVQYDRWDAFPILKVFIVSGAGSHQLATLVFASLFGVNPATAPAYALIPALLWVRPRIKNKINDLKKRKENEKKAEKNREKDERYNKKIAANSALMQEMTKESQRLTQDLKKINDVLGKVKSRFKSAFNSVMKSISSPVTSSTPVAQGPTATSLIQGALKKEHKGSLPTQTASIIPIASPLSMSASIEGSDAYVPVDATPISGEPASGESPLPGAVPATLVALSTAADKGVRFEPVSRPSIATSHAALNGRSSSRNKNSRPEGHVRGKSSSKGSPTSGSSSATGRTTSFASHTPTRPSAASFGSHSRSSS